MKLKGSPSASDDSSPPGKLLCVCACVQQQWSWGWLRLVRNPNWVWGSSCTFWRICLSGCYALSLASCFIMCDSGIRAAKEIIGWNPPCVLVSSYAARQNRISATFYIPERMQITHVLLFKCTFVITTPFSPLERAFLLETEFSECVLWPWGSTGLSQFTFPGLSVRWIVNVDCTLDSSHIHEKLWLHRLGGWRCALLKNMHGRRDISNVSKLFKDACP